MKSACTLPSLSDIVNTNGYFYTRQSTKPSILHVSSLLSPTRTDSVLYESDEPTCFPSTELRIELGKRLGMSPRTVQIWFQNKRQSTRTRERVTPQQQRRSMFVSPPVSPLPSPSLIKSLSLPPLHPPPAFALSPSSSAHSSPTSIDAMLFRDF
ncbi:Putative Homeobox domain-containing protein [Rhizopus microsporus]|nr:Putative Homeobox domain-containing protein [Rhizopus microsporus]CEI96808.1 Putative Homeobox domain-containing protein [Rhizopus microsporus]